MTSRVAGVRLENLHDLKETYNKAKNAATRHGLSDTATLSLEDGNILRVTQGGKGAMTDRQALLEKLTELTVGSLENSDAWGDSDHKQRCTAAQALVSLSSSDLSTFSMRRFEKLLAAVEAMGKDTQLAETMAEQGGDAAVALIGKRFEGGAYQVKSRTPMPAGSAPRRRSCSDITRAAFHGIGAAAWGVGTWLLSPASRRYRYLHAISLNGKFITGYRETHEPARGVIRRIKDVAHGLTRADELEWTRGFVQQFPMSPAWGGVHAGVVIAAVRKYPECSAIFAQHACEVIDSDEEGENASENVPKWMLAGFLLMNVRKEHLDGIFLLPENYEKLARGTARAISKLSSSSTSKLTGEAIVTASDYVASEYGDRSAALQKPWVAALAQDFKQRLNVLKSNTDRLQRVMDQCEPTELVAWLDEGLSIAEIVERGERLLISASHDSEDDESSHALPMTGDSSSRPEEAETGGGELETKRMGFRGAKPEADTPPSRWTRRKRSSQKSSASATPATSSTVAADSKDMPPSTTSKSLMTGKIKRSTPHHDPAKYKSASSGQQMAKGWKSGKFWQTVEFRRLLKERNIRREKDAKAAIRMAEERRTASDASLV